MLEEVTPEPKDDLLDLRKLSEAVAVAETSGCKRGAAISNNNCHGIMSWPGGIRTLIKFNSTEESHRAFMDLWSRKYEEFPDIALARKYTGNDNAERWLAIVTNYYNQ